jgi:O-antigen ligase
VLAVLAVPPLAVSTDRGAWLSLVIGLGYVAIRLAIRGSARPLGAILACGVLAVAVVAVTPLGSVVQSRLDGAGASNDTRQNLYVLAWERTQDAPLVGYGEPIPNAPDPPIGTHGLIWYGMVAHGIPGLLMILAMIGALLASTFRSRTRTALWVHAVIVICAVQLPFYGLLPQIVIVGFAAGICWREDHPELVAHG